jgi:hypothetical protein
MLWLSVSNGLAAGPASSYTDGKDPLSSDMDEIRRRLTTVEQEQANIREQARQSQRAADLYSLVDHDVADVRLAFSQQRQVLNAIGQTQAEHTAALRRQGDVLGGLVLEMTTIRHTQTEHGHLLNAHTEMLSEQGQVLNTHTEMLSEHGQVLNTHTEMLSQHGQVLNTHTETLSEHTQMLTEQGQMLRQVLDRLPAAEN